MCYDVCPDVEGSFTLFHQYPNPPDPAHNKANVGQLLGPTLLCPEIKSMVLYREYQAKDSFLYSDVGCAAQMQLIKNSYKNSNFC